VGRAPPNLAKPPSAPGHRYPWLVAGVGCPRCPHAPKEREKGPLPFGPPAYPLMPLPLNPSFFATPSLRSIALRTHRSAWSSRSTPFLRVLTPSLRCFPSQPGASFPPAPPALPVGARPPELRGHRRETRPPSSPAGTTLARCHRESSEPRAPAGPRVHPVSRADREIDRLPRFLSQPWPRRGRNRGPGPGRHRSSFSNALGRSIPTRCPGWRREKRMSLVFAALAPDRRLVCLCIAVPTAPSSPWR